MTAACLLTTGAQPDPTQHHHRPPRRNFRFVVGILGATRLPDGLDTVLGERGWSISDGEAQRVALARAFLSDAGLVLLDEPTAHLDAATEAALMEPLARLLEGRTVLLASHSDVVLGLADRVIDLDGGRIRG
jgi:ATP-binding cassette, subfamily C, bacterial CydD